MMIEVIPFRLICIYALMRLAEPKIFHKITIQSEKEDHPESQRVQKVKVVPILYSNFIVL